MNTHAKRNTARACSSPPRKKPRRRRESPRPRAESPSRTSQPTANQSNDNQIKAAAPTHGEAPTVATTTTKETTTTTQSTSRSTLLCTLYVLYIPTMHMYAHPTLVGLQLAVDLARWASFRLLGGPSCIVFVLVRCNPLRRTPSLSPSSSPSCPCLAETRLKKRVARPAPHHLFTEPSTPAPYLAGW